MSLKLNDPATWDAIAEAILTKEDYHYDTSDLSHCTDMAQIVCKAIVNHPGGLETMHSSIVHDCCSDLAEERQITLELASEIHGLQAEIERLKRVLTEKALDLIEARNPGIDREEVRKQGGFQ